MLISQTRQTVGGQIANENLNLEIGQTLIYYIICLADTFRCDQSTFLRRKFCQIKAFNFSTRQIVARQSTNENLS